MNVSYNNLMLRMIKMSKHYKKTFFIVTFAISLLTILCSLNFYEFLYNEQVYSCELNQEIDYNVKIFPNDVFDKTILTSNDVYISKLVDDINVQYNYSHTSDDSGKLDLYYTVNATTLVIEKSDKNSTDISKVPPIKKKEHILKNREVVSTESGRKGVVSDEILIDFDVYKKEAEEFKKDIYSSSYSALLLDFKVEAVKHIDNVPDISVVSTGSLKIPLDQESFIITTNLTKNQNKKYTRYETPKLYINYTLLIIGCLLLILDLILFYLNQRFYYRYFLNTSKNIKIEKFLFEYNDVIFESEVKPDFKNKNKIILGHISEMIDLYSLIKQPIIYYKEKIGENLMKNHFFVNYYDVVYVFIFETNL